MSRPTGFGVVTPEMKKGLEKMIKEREERRNRFKRGNRKMGGMRVRKLAPSRCDVAKNHIQFIFDNGTRQTKILVKRKVNEYIEWDGAYGLLEEKLSNIHRNNILVLIHEITRKMKRCPRLYQLTSDNS